MLLLLGEPITKFLTMRLGPGSPRGWRRRRRRVGVSMARGDGVVEETVEEDLAEGTVATAEDVEVVVIELDTGEAGGDPRENLMIRERTDTAEVPVGVASEVDATEKMDVVVQEEVITDSVIRSSSQI